MFTSDAFQHRVIPSVRDLLGASGARGKADGSPPSHAARRSRHPAAISHPHGRSHGSAVCEGSPKGVLSLSLHVRWNLVPAVWSVFANSHVHDVSSGRAGTGRR